MTDCVPIPDVKLAPATVRTLRPFDPVAHPPDHSAGRLARKAAMASL